MVKLSELRTAAETHERDMLSDPAYRREIERTRLANDVAIKVIQYRTAHSMSQTDLARMLGMRQPNVARLESGDHEPSLDTLARLSSALKMDFSVDVKPGALRLRHPARSRGVSEAPAPTRRRTRANPLGQPLRTGRLQVAARAGSDLAQGSVKRRDEQAVPARNRRG